MQNFTSASLISTNAIPVKNYFNRLFVLFALLFALFIQASHAQSTANYAFTTGTSGSLISDLHGNTVDMSTGTTVVVGPGLDASNGIGVTNIGFDFYLMGSRFTQFSAQDDGLMQLGSSAVSTNTYTISGGTVASPRLSAFNADMRTGTTTGKIHYKLIGAAPNRVLVVEFLDMQLFYTGTAAAGTSRFQVRLYENTGVIEYMYGAMSATDITSGNKAPSIGFYTGSATGSFASVAYATNTSSTTSPYSANPAIAATGDIAGLNSVTEGSRRFYRYAPVVTAAPSALTFSAVTSNSMTVNWTAASPTTNVLKYAIYNSTDGGATYNFVNTVALGTNTLAVSGLTPGTSYLWQVSAVSEGAFASATGTQATNAAAGYTWNGSVSTAYSVAANWTPSRTTAVATDVLTIDGAITATPTITGFTSQSIGQLLITNNANVNLQSSATATLTITGGGGADLNIPAGSSLNLSGTSSIGIAFSGSQVVNIAGILKTSTTATGTLNFTNSVATVTGTMELSSATNSYTGTALTTSFAAGANCIMGSNSLVIPVATWAATSNLNITGIVANTGSTNGAQSFGNVTYNCPAATGTMSFFTSSTVSIQGSLTIQATNTGRFRALTSGTLNIAGNLNVNGGTFEVASTTGTINVAGTVNVSGGILDVTSGTGAATLKANGTFNQTGGTINTTGTSSTNNIEFNGIAAQSVTIGNMGTGPVGFRVNNATGVTLNGTMLINNTASLTISNGNITGSGTVIYSGATSRLIYNSINNAQTANSIEFPAASGPASLTINNTNASPNNVVNIPFSRSLGSGGVLTLTAGILDNTGNTLTVTNTTTGGISGGSATSYVKGAVARTLPASLASGSTYTFPVGKTTYNPFELVNPTTNAGGSVIAQAEVFDAATGGTPGALMASINTGRYWAASLNGATSANFTNSFIRLNDTRNSLDGIAASSTLTGSYDHIGGATSTLTTTSITSTAPAIVSLPGFFVMGNVAAPAVADPAISPSGTQCFNTARTVTVTVTPGAGAITTVTINYTVNAGSVQTVAMTNTSGNTWSGTIPTVTPSNGTVAWSVTATDANGFATSASGASYSDEPLTGTTATAVASLTTVCSGSPVILTASLNKSFTATAGNGGTTSATYPNPVYSNWANNKLQILYLASELTAKGFGAGKFSSLSFNLTATSATARNNFTIQMAGTSATAVTTTYLTPSFTQVYTNASLVPVVGTNTFAFGTGAGSSNNFTWDGTSNLLIQICWDNTASTSTISSTCTAENTTFNSVVSYNRTSTTGTSVCGITVTGSTVYTVRPTLTFSGDFAPAVTAVSWSDGTNTVGTTNPLTVNPATSTTYTATLSAAGCTIATNALAITVNPLPASPGANNSTQCGTGVPGAFVTSGGGGAGFKWYDAQTGGNLLQSSGASYTSSISTTTHFWVSESNGNCESARVEVVASVSTPDPVSASSDGPVCSGSSLTLTATVTTGTNSNNYTYTWTASPAAGSGIPTSQAGGTGTFGSPASTVVTPTSAGTYTYTVSGVDGSCTSVNTVIVTIKALPQINSTTATASTICAGVNVTLNGTTGTQGAGTATIGAGATTNGGYVTTGNEGFGNPYNYWYGNHKTQFIYKQSELAAAGMSAGNLTALSYEVTALGAAYSMTGFTISIANTAQSVATSTPITTGFTQVYTSASQAVTTGINNYTFTTPFSWNGTSNIVVQVCWGNSNSGVTASTATVKSDVAPFVSTTIMYQDGSVGTGICAQAAGGNQNTSSNRPKIVFAAISGVNTTSSMNWSWNPGSLTGSTVIVNPSTTTTYTVTATDPVTTCSASNTVTVTVNPLPPAPSGTNGTDQCGNAITDASVSSNSGAPSPVFNWYLVPTGGTAVQTGTSTTYLSPVSETTNFYVSEISAEGCEGPRVSFSTIVSEPDPLTVSATSSSVCVGSSFDISSSYTPNFNAFATFDLSATGGAASGVTGTVALTANGTGTDPYTITPTATGTYTYTITAVDPDKGCTSVDMVVVTVNELPAITSATASNTTVCEGADVVLTAATIGASGTATVGAGATSVSSYNAPFYSLWSNKHLQILFTQAELAAAGLVAGNITSLSFPTTSGTVANLDYSLKLAQTTATNISSFVTTGFTTVYTAASQPQVANTNNTITLTTPFAWNGTSNLVIDICFGNSASTATLSSTSPADPTSYVSVREEHNTTSTGGSAICGSTGSNTSNFSVRPKVLFGYIQVLTGNYNWTWNPGGATGSTVTVNPTTTTAYTATATNPSTGCSAGSQPVTVTVNPLPAAPSTNNPVTRCGPGSVTLTATGSGGILNWYDVSTGGISLHTGSTYTTSVSASTSFWVAETSAAGCQGPRSLVNVTITPAPALSITAGGPVTFCDGGSVTLNGASNSDPSFTNFTWSANPVTGSGLSSTTGSVITAAPTAAGSYIITLTADDGIAGGCSNIATVVVTANANPVITSVAANPSTICAGAGSTLTATSLTIAAGTATLGAGGTTTSGTAAQTPFYGTYGGAKTQYLVRASELTALGFAAGNITSLALDVSGVGSTLNGFAISMEPTSLTALTSNIETTSTQVYGQTFVPVAGINTFAFTTPFNWNGTSNIIISFCFSNNNTSNTATNLRGDNPGFVSGNARYVDSRTAAEVCGYTGNTTPSGWNGSATTASFRPKFILGGQRSTDISATYNWVWNPGGLTGNITGITPSVTTTYTATATNASTGCFAVSSPVTVTVTSVAANPTASPASPVCAGTAVTLAAGATGGGPFTYAWASTPAGTYTPDANGNISVTPTVTTTYTVTVTDICANSTSSEITVTVNPLPTVTVSPSSAGFCSPGGTAVTLTAGGAASYTWSPATGLSSTTGQTVNASPTVSTSYIVTGTGDNGCNNTATAVVTVSPNVQGATASALPVTLCEGATINLASSANAIPGYTINPNSGVAFIDISTTGASVGTVGDDSEHNISIPSFTLNGVAYTAARVGANGVMVFGATAGEITLTNAALPTTSVAAGNIFVAPWWDDLDINMGGTIKTQTVGNKFVIEYIGMDHNLFTTGTVTFEVQLDLTTGAIHYIYPDVIFGSATYDQGLTGTVGLQWSSTAAIQYSFDQASLVNGQSITFTPNSLSYSWTGPNSFTSTLQNPAIPVATTAASGAYTVVISSNAGCSASVTTAAVTVNPHPTGVISGSGAFCQGAANTNTNLTLTFTGTGPWNYTYTDGTTPVSGTTSNNPATITVSPGSATPGVVTYTITALSDANCTAVDGDWSGSGTVTINPLAANPTATVLQPTCAVGTGTITVTAPLGTGNSYTLDGTTTITWPTVSFPGVAPGPHTITVTNSFGCSAPASASVTVNPQPFVPGAPVVTGIVNVCPHIGTLEQITYHATATGNGTQTFNWVIPPTNVTIVSGQGTADLVLTFQNGFATQGNKQLRLTVTNACGTSPMSIYYLLAQLPNTPNPIVASSSDVCRVIGTANYITYTIPKAISATEYIWTAPSGANIIFPHPNPAGPNDTTVRVTFTAGYATGSITVSSKNDCGISPVRSLLISRTNPATPGLIAGPTNACEFTAPNGTPATYSVTQTPGMTYNWTVPAGATGLTGQGTNTISFTYPAGFTSGSISVTATNGCGTSGPRTLSITRLNPGTPGVIDVIQTAFCGDAPLGTSRVFTYTLASMPANATSVQWTIPVGAQLVSGQGTTSITVRYPDAAVNGAVTVQAVSNCAVSTVRSTTVKLPACPVAFTRTENTNSSQSKSTAATTTAAETMEVKIFPNPTVSDFKLEVLTSSKEEINVRVIDAQGRLFKSFKLIPHQTIALGAELKAGSYLVEVRQGSVVKTTKVIKF